MSIEATRARRAREKQQLHVDDPRMAFLGTAGGGGPTLSDEDPQDVGAAADPGEGSKVSRDDHVHKGGGAILHDENRVSYVAELTFGGNSSLWESCGLDVGAGDTLEGIWQFHASGYARSPAGGNGSWLAIGNKAGTLTGDYSSTMVILPTGLLYPWHVSAVLNCGGGSTVGLIWNAYSSADHLFLGENYYPKYGIILTGIQLAPP